MTKSEDSPSRLSEKEIFVVFDVVEQHGNVREARDEIGKKLHVRPSHRITLTLVFRVAVEFSRRNASVLTDSELDEVIEKVGYGVSRHKVIELHRLYQLWKIGKRGTAADQGSDEELLREWRRQLNCPPPELLFVDSLGRIGQVNSAPLGKGIISLAMENVRLSFQVTRTTWPPDNSGYANSVSWELPLDGTPKLLCPVERKPGFPELFERVSNQGRQSFGEWKSLGGRYLHACMRARTDIHEETKTRAGGPIVADAFFEKIRSDLSLPLGPRIPSRLNVEFGDLIYSLALECKRSPDLMHFVGRLYTARQKSLFCELVFGHPEGTVLAMGFPGEVEKWTELHQSMIREYAQSEVIGRVTGLYQRLVALEKLTKVEIDRKADRRY
ncbi:MAG: hypothetical protein HYX90_08385 [Chloroflexi bacterium]|nr:hypothetical protein [Chloroflexota bacterium]